jgi:hypothetical protein
MYIYCAPMHLPYFCRRITHVRMHADIIHLASKYVPVLYIRVDGKHSMYRYREHLGKAFSLQLSWGSRGDDRTKIGDGGFLFPDIEGLYVVPVSSTDVLDYLTADILRILNSLTSSSLRYLATFISLLLHETNRRSYLLYVHTLP